MKITILCENSILEFSKNIFYLWEIPRNNSFENWDFENDNMSDDSAIVIKSKNWAIVITGCSHSGICNICEYAKKISNQNLYAIIWWFHLFEENNEMIKNTIDYFKNENPKYLLPMHCIDVPTLSKFYTTFWIKKYSTGDIIEIDD